MDCSVRTVEQAKWREPMRKLVIALILVAVASLGACSNGKPGGKPLPPPFPQAGTTSTITPATIDVQQ